MPFTMTHLWVAKLIHDLPGNRIADLPQFYLGAIAPDAVHNRAAYVSDFKKASHLRTDPEGWGMITDNDAWIANVLTFLNSHRESVHRDFILGYCVHVLTDIYNNLTVWEFFRSHYPRETAQAIYYRESGKVDTELALSDENTELFWSHLENARGVDLEDIIYASELETQREYILRVWFKDKARPDLSENAIVTYESARAFIRNAADFVAQYRIP